MARYHINPNTGNPNKCTAKPGGCPFALDNEHFDTSVEARAAYEARMDEATDALRSVQKDIASRRKSPAELVAEEARESFAVAPEGVTGLVVLNKKGEVETTIPLSQSELDMPGYLEHLEKSYADHGWQTERLQESRDEYCFICKRPTDHTGEHDDLVEAGMAEYANGMVRRTGYYDPEQEERIRAASWEAYSARFAVPEIEETEAVKALREELERLENSPARYQSGFPEDEMIRYNIEQKIGETKRKLKELAPDWDPDAENKLKDAEAALAILIANAKVNRDYPYERPPARELRFGETTYTDVVVAHVQYNKTHPGVGARRHSDTVTREILVPNVNRYTAKKKLAVAEELYRQAGADLSKWMKLSDEQKIRWAESRMGKYSELTIKREGDTVSWSNRYSSSNQKNIDNITILDLG